MRLWLSDLFDRFDLLSLRERVMVMGAAVLLTVLAWDTLLMEPQARVRKVRLGQVEALRAEVTGLEQGVEAMAAQGALDPDRQNREAIEALRGEIAALDAQMAGATTGLIAPKEMTRVLEELLDRTARVTLLGLRTLPAETVSAPAARAATGAPAAPGAQIYKHGVELELAGSYLEMLGFLEAVEALPWRFFWDRIEFTVEEHPRGRAKLTLYTLGLQEGWVGV